MNTTRTDAPRCSYCYRRLTSDRLIFQAGALFLHLHPPCARQLALDFHDVADNYYNDRYLGKQAK